ncbi:hypothetical protein SAMN04488009_0101 [Maribacter sedimenticola]|uniref:DUF2178 domain-containing protein n=1 Tax=Maribacter sedimenticola TaxID=228956 RepID=A0ABY1SM49_9FLAO|nr:hypothetical protein [Maribacter sedimenticola]SNR79593.1 hypothetical protein SAMN04488009_0101 [Maribacter sedimenticola]
MKSEYKGWLIAILILPFIIGFEKSFSELEVISDLNNWTIILRLLCLVFIASFFVFAMFSGEFGFHESLGSREYENEDLNRFKKNLKKSLSAYSIALLIWIIAISLVIFEYGKRENIWQLSYLLVLPIVFIGLMVYIYYGIKTAYNKT